MRDILPRRYRKEIKKNLRDIENKKNLSKLEKEEINDYLTKLVRILSKEEEYGYNDRDDPDYYGIRDIENLFSKVEEEDCYKPILVKSSFKHSYKYYERRGDRNKNLSVKQYLNKITHHLHDIMNDHKPNIRTSKAWKIQIPMCVNFISSKDTGEIRTIYVWSNNESIMWGSDTNDIIKDLFESFLYNYQEELKTISGSDFVFESAELMNYKLHIVSLKRGGSYIKSSEWFVNEKATINPKNENDDNCFQYAITSALNYTEIKKRELENIFKKIKHEDTDFSSHQRGWEKFEQNNESIALNVLFSPQDSEEITFIYKSENNYKRENNVLLLMINDNEKYFYFAVKSTLELYSSEWLGIKKEAIITGDNCFQNALNDALDYQRIKKDPQKILEIKPYISQYNWKDINFLSHKEDWKMFQQNNKESALNILFVLHNKKEIIIAYKSKYNHKRKNQVILLMITDGKKWRYLAVRSLSALLREVTSSNN